MRTIVNKGERWGGGGLILAIFACTYYVDDPYGVILLKYFLADNLLLLHAQKVLCILYLIALFSFFSLKRFLILLLAALFVSFVVFSI